MIKYQTKILGKTLDLDPPYPMMKLSGLMHVNLGHIRHSSPFSHRVQHMWLIEYTIYIGKTINTSPESSGMIESKC